MAIRSRIPQELSETEQGSSPIIDTIPKDSGAGYPEFTLSEQEINDAGLSNLKDGDEIYVPTKLRIKADASGKVTGVCVTALGSPLSEPPEEDTLVAISGGSSVESDEDNTNKDQSDGVTTDGSDDEFIGKTPEEEIEKETKMLGYKRPRAPKSKLPKAKDFLMGQG